MGKLQLFEITFQNRNAVVKTGETLRGRVVIHLGGPMKMKRLKIWFKGLAKVRWSESDGDGSDTYKAEEEYFDKTVILYESEGSTLGAGRFTYDFELPVPADCPSSFEGEYVHVRYVCKATLVRPWKFDHHVKSAFTVLRPLNLNLEPASRQEPMECHETKNVLCSCCIPGTINATFRIDKTGYAPGENMVINAEVHNNTNSTIGGTRVALKQEAVFFGSLYQSSKSVAKRDIAVVAEEKRPEIEAGQSDTWNNVSLRIPALPPSGLEGCNIIHVSYYVNFYVKALRGIKMTAPILIGTIPFMHSSGGQLGVQVEQPKPSLDIYGAPTLSSESACAFPLLDLAHPPPSYEECVKGHVQITDDSDTQYTRGQLSWAPSYPTYQSLSNTSTDTAVSSCIPKPLQ